MSSRVKAVLFDLDGTLVDSAPDLHVAANLIMAENDRRQLTLAEVIKMIGDGVPKLVERSFAATGEVPSADQLAAHSKRFLEHYEPHAADLSTPFPGGVECLGRLKAAGYDLAVCTNKPYDATMEMLKTLKLDEHLSVVIGGDTLPGIKKPDPRHLQAALEKLGVGPDEAIMVGDNANDVNAAKGADIPVIVCRFGYTNG
ncbi:MAG: phosphoglycolate phosphatase, partial [Alphaproteobacteria bacterium]